MKITNSTQRDIPEIFRLYKLATDFQKEKFPENQWPEFDEKLISNEVMEDRQFKLVIENKIACIWAITYSDPQIWEDEGEESSIYIHRIATNPNFRGNNFVKIIVDWAKELADTQHKRFIKMDTCGDNEKLINHYKKCGFDFLGIKKLNDSSGLPSHYHGADVCFFEIKLKRP
ncbi:GNAT family N-acetyltransferase [Galbibacter pacificus]|uniref:GNAT family N-acetyltransferase n=1 Tax=Galbibacter pacificus TaxID=2996052 RepID=A0ABT6FMS8_9FLAO|nr:GNAT family N-acetyltransferase [Galbibacter pacificus]MDG3581077.1 GNAT family N-acetyltransferase [Galbibacter pacificus]MDG3584555.1 GNAT family N-acetyltransferase [Galbibacter pacificus]